MREFNDPRATGLLITATQLMQVEPNRKGTGAARRVVEGETEAGWTSLRDDFQPIIWRW